MNTSFLVKILFTNVLVLTLQACLHVCAQESIEVSNQYKKEYFSLSDAAAKTATIYTDADDIEVVKIATGMSIAAQIKP